MKNVEFVRRENDGYLEAIKIDGKKVKASFVRGWRKAEKTPYFILHDEPMTATNPFSGLRVLLNPIEATIYYFCIQWYNRYSYGQTDVPIQTYDDMKYFLLEINPKAYFDLLD